MNKRFLSITIGIFLVFALTVLSLVFAVNQANAQNDVVNEIKQRLREKNIPVKSVEIESRLPFKLDIQLQSTTSTENANPDDAIFTYLVEREMAEAKKRGIEISGVKVTLLNEQGKPIYWADVPVRQLRTGGKSNAQMSERVLEADFRADLKQDGIQIEEFQVTSTEGKQNIQVRLTTPNIESANKGIAQFMQTLSTKIRRFNADGSAQITLVHVDLFDGTGKPLLKYVYDYEMKKETWWQADGLTSDWFPHPAP